VVSPDGKFIFARLQKGVHFNYDDIRYTDDAGNIDLKSPIQRISFYPDKIKALIAQACPGVKSDEAAIIFNFKTNFPWEVFEYDASRVGPGEYTGEWNR